MKLTDEQIKKYLKDTHIECDEDTLRGDWVFDEKFGFINVVDKGKMVYLKNDSDAWLRILYSDLSQQQKDELFTDEAKANELAWDYVKQSKLDLEQDKIIEIFKAGYSAAEREHYTTK